jgi:hypothetical protein
MGNVVKPSKPPGKNDKPSEKELRKREDLIKYI